MPDTDTGWTHVRHKTRRAHRHNPPAQGRSASTSSPAETFTPRTANLRPASALEADYKKFQTQWLDSPCRASLVELIRQHATQCAAVADVVCLGIGTFDPEDGGWESKRSAYMQLCALETIASEIDSIANTSIQCIHQEPILTTSDKEFLSNLGHKVVDSPKGCEAIGENTLLFGIHLYRPIYAMALKSCLPAVFIGTPWDVWDEVTLEKSDDLKNLEAMEKTYSKVDFPADPSSTAFSSTAIYFRPRGGDGNTNTDENSKADDTQEEATRKAVESLQRMGLEDEQVSGEAQSQGSKASAAIRE
ncbi:hypothetical protein K4F52_005644 [Lecanicillium sp. MT-2017a]|nr:hypothetical protein K4F52_005644 [Lecanicillium sp. MT-2017a]